MIYIKAYVQKFPALKFLESKTKITSVGVLFNIFPPKPAQA